MFIQPLELALLVGVAEEVLDVVVVIEVEEVEEVEEVSDDKVELSTDDIAADSAMERLLPIREVPFAAIMGIIVVVLLLVVGAGGGLVVLRTLTAERNNGVCSTYSLNIFG